MEQDNLLTFYHTLSENLDRLQEQLNLLAAVIKEQDEQIAIIKESFLKRYSNEK